MKVKFEIKMLKTSAVEMTITREIGDFPHDFGKVISTFSHSNSVSDI